MTYDEVMTYIGSLEKFGSVLGLDSIRELMRRLGNPQDSIETIHIAGTNGKGSVITYIEYILRSAGYRVGKYISPSVVSYWERIQLDGNDIEMDDVAYCAEKVKKACEAMVKEGMAHPTVFEFETAMAFLYFKVTECDVALIETGMGGLLDATNIIKKPLCEIITSVSMDHIGVLGNSLEEIAECKAGIIMEDTDVVLYGGDAVVEQVVKKVADNRNARLHVSDFSLIKDIQTNQTYLINQANRTEQSNQTNHSKYNKQENTSDYYIDENKCLMQRFTYGSRKDICIRMLGMHQCNNAVVAIDAVDILRDKGFSISEYAIRDGLANAVWPGRFEILCSEPVIVLDGAHNVDAAIRLRESVLEYFPEKKKIFIMGMFRDKEYPKIIELTNDLASEIITINSDNQRSIPADELKQIIDRMKVSADLKVMAAANPTEGIIRAVWESHVIGTENTVIIAFGSLSFLGEIRNSVKKMVHAEG